MVAGSSDSLVHLNHDLGDLYREAQSHSFILNSQTVDCVIFTREASEEQDINTFDCFQSIQAAALDRSSRV